MTQALVLLLVAGALGYFVWKRCDFIPDLCKDEKPGDKAASGPSDVHVSPPVFAPNHATCKVVNGKLMSVDATGKVLAECGSSNYAYAHYAKTLSQHGARLHI